MVVRFILVFLSSLLGTSVHAQFKQETGTRVPWKNFGFIKSSSSHHRSVKDCGIYSTAGDRTSGTLSLAIDCRSEDHRITSGFIGDRSAIKIVHNDKKIKYLKRDIYGYRDCHGNEYHFFDGRSYELINPGESLGIYRAFEWKGKQRVTKFFFARNSDAGVTPLTVKNLRAAFADEPAFLKKLELFAGNDFQLVKHLHVINRARLDAQQQSTPVAELL